MKQMQELVNITQVLYLKEQAAVQDILSKEAALRSKLAQIDQQVLQARDNARGVEPMKTTGADVIWLAWVGRAKTQLNLQLAQVLARKLLVMDKVRIAFGKTQVARQMAQTDANTQRKKRQGQLLASAYEVHGNKY